MKTVCCVCRKTKSRTGWIHGQAEKDGRVSHGYCPECFNQTMELAQGWLLAKNSKTPGLALGR